MKSHAVILMLCLILIPLSAQAKDTDKKKKAASPKAKATAQSTPLSGKSEKPLSQDPALRDLKALFARSLASSHDTAFTDPAVGGLATVPLRLNVASQEGGP